MISTPPPGTTQPSGPGQPFAPGQQFQQPQYPYQPGAQSPYPPMHLPPPGWVSGWARYLFLRIGVPVVVCLSLIYLYGKLNGIYHQNPAGNWESVDSGPGLTMVLQRDGKGWLYVGPPSETDRDIKWELKDGKLIVRNIDDSNRIDYGFGISEDGQQMTLRNKGHVFRLERLQGEPPPRPTHTQPVGDSGNAFPSDNNSNQ